MSLCLDSNNVLANQVSTAATIQLSEKSISENAPILTSTSPTSSSIELNDTQQLLHKKSVTKLLVSNHQTSVVGNPVLQKISNPPVITVLNSTGGPLTVLKTICVTSGVSSTPHFSLVNNQSLTVTNAVGKTPTITLLNTPVTVVKMPPPRTQNVDNKPVENINCPVSMQNVSTIIENRAHNVFVKNTCSESEVPQSHKFLTSNSFSQTNVLTSIPTSSGKSVNSQRSKLKILGNVVVPSMTSTSNNQQTTNQVINKTNAQLQHQQQRLVSRQKVLGCHGGQPKYINKLQNNGQQKSVCALKQNLEKVQPQAKVMYPTHKSQIKTLPPVNNYMPKAGMKTLNSHQPKSIPTQIQRTGSGLRTIPPQRPPKLPNKLNYIGKHAVQAQKVKHGQNRLNKPMKQAGLPFYNNCIPQSHANKQLAFNQALTAEILETLGNKSGPTTSFQNKSYEILPNQYVTPNYAEEQQCEPPKREDNLKSGLDALSLICQAVLLDHNYNATLPPDSPTRTGSLTNNPLQANGMSGNSMLIYSPGSSSKGKYPPERKPSCSNPVSTSSSLSNISLSLPSNSTSLINLQDDDVASDISDCSDRKHDTEGEETDTAPEAEAVNNEEIYDHYGDYVTRCICGFLHDDGYMVECDQCKVWQHVQCVVKNKQVPDEYLCERCNPSKPVDPHKARMIQQQWLRERQLPEMKNFKKDTKIKEIPKNKEIPSDTDSSDAENPRNNNNTAITKGRTPLAQRKKSDKQLTKQKKELKEANLRRKSFKKRERKFIRRKSKLQTKKAEEDNRDTVVMAQLPQLRQWIENYEEAVTNHYSPELRARISNIRVNGSQNIDTSVRFDPSVNKCSVYTLPLIDLKYLVATDDISQDSAIIELRGKYMLSIQHRNPGNLNTRQHAQRPGPFLFFYRLNKDNTEVCVDTRTYGNIARFVRRSCKPNAELRHCIEKGVLHLYIVAISQIEKSAEITIKHESHDLAAIGTTQISCYCGNPTECKVNKSTVKKNGDSVSEIYRKKRGRRTTSVSTQSEPDVSTVPVKETVTICEPLPPPIPPIIPRSPSPIKVETGNIEIQVKNEIIEESIDIKEEMPDITEVKMDFQPIKEENHSTPVEVKIEPENVESSEMDEDDVKKEGKENECSKSPISVPMRRSSQHKVERDKDEEEPAKEEKNKCKKLSREERKLEAILRAIEQMEKANQRKQEHKQTKHVQRRESEPPSYSRDEEKSVDLKQKRKRRKGRARTTSTHSARRDRLNSGDSYFTSGDENMLSPNDGVHPKKAEETDDCTSGKHEGYLLTFSNNNETNRGSKSPVRENDSNSNSAHSSPETPLSLACSLVQAAVEPLEPGFKFPKTKKGLMNEWLNKTPESAPIISSPLSVHINNTEMETSSNVCTPYKNISNESGPKGSAKKRWLRQAISEDKCDSPQESPPISDMVAPPKKRRLPRESISNDITPPSTPTSFIQPENRMDCDPGNTSQEIRSFQLYEDSSDNPKDIFESDLVLKERVDEMKQEFDKSLTQSVTSEMNQRTDTLSLGCLMDPRLRNHNFTNSEHLVGTVEKTLSIFGFEEQKPETIPPAKRKLSITEYRQRKKLNNNEVNDKCEETISTEDCVIEENNSLESFQMMPTRPRLNSPSSSSSSSSDDETSVITELPAKVPAFNSEPTELERQRELQSLRLKKAFGLSIDIETKKPAVTGDSIFKSELTALPLIKSFTGHTSPSNSTTSNCEVSDLSKSTLNSPRLHAILTHQTTDQAVSSPNIAEQERESPVEKLIPSTTSTPVEEPLDDVSIPLSPKKEILDEEKILEFDKFMEFEEDPVKEEKMDEEEIKPHMFYTPDEEETGEKGFPEIESINYVPPFNNPIYPSINYTSVIDEEGRYEGRNPSPPPSHLDSGDIET